MKTKLFFLFSVCLLCSNLFAQTQSNVIAGELIVMMKSNEAVETLLREPLGFTTRVVHLQHQRTLSKRLNIHLLSYNPTIISAEAATKMLQSHPRVELAQPNHRVEDRATYPTDPGFPQQWGFENTGQNGGTPDADIDAPEAWDFTTGGLTSQGDTIVVAVVDGGVDLAHEDLVLWKNHAEIPNNGIDDDNNGYIDDYDGWDAYNSDGTVPNDGHGTHVSGTVSARGNNGLGVVGVNWDAQVMPIAASSGNEATVVEGYSYAYDMRFLYNQTNGAEGAFVVATNSSFGVNNGDPADYPIWSAMYDSMGAVGILSAGATMNVNADVDVTLDVPTACPSPHMISVTNTTPDDQKNNGAAYGLTTIDLGAPGTNIYSCQPGDSYGNSTGTSMATPHVAGAVALLISAACPELINQYKADPANVALTFRDLLFQGVDTIPALQGITVTGGRLNIHKSILLLQDYCASIAGGCLTPYAVNLDQTTDSTALVGWANIDSAQGYLVQYQMLGDTSWIMDTVMTNSIQLENLMGCSSYTIQISALCDSSNSDFSQPFTFETEGCCDIPDNIQVILQNPGPDSTYITWDAVYAAQGYHLQYRPQGSPNWQTATVSAPEIALLSLDSCSLYEFQVETICDTTTSGYSMPFTLEIGGCGFCVDAPYCDAFGDDASEEWIESVEIGPLQNTSGSDNGYALFATGGGSFVQGASYNVNLEPGFSGNSFSEYWRIWIDSNRDGAFDINDLVYDSGSASPNTATGSFTIPPLAQLGNTRMRVAMRFNFPMSECGDFAYGEVEDYCIEIVSNAGACLPPSQIDVVEENEEDASLNWMSASGAVAYWVVAFDASGGAVTYNTNDTTFTLSGLMPCQSYEVQIATICGNDTSALSAPISIQTSGCGFCIEGNYCESNGDDASEEWIDSVIIGTYTNASGNDGGYGDYTSAGLSMQRGSVYATVLVPGFDGDVYSEYWMIWVDWNQDGDFDDADELVYDAGGISSTVQNTNVTVPATATLGKTRMRVSMKYNAMPGSCEEFDFGEVEDYCVEILDNVGVETLAEGSIRLFPNPNQGIVQVEASLGMDQLVLRNALGQVVMQVNANRQLAYRLDMSEQPSGWYSLEVWSNGARAVMKVVKE